MNIPPAHRMAHVQKSIIRQIFEAAQGDALNLGLGEIQFDTPLPIRQFASQIALKENGRYTFNAGTSALRKKISDYYNGKVKPQGICVTCGAAEALHSIITSYVNPGDEVMLADPTFLAYESSVKMNQGIVVKYSLDPLNSFALDKEDFESKISSKTKIVIICNPSNPLSICFSQNELEFIASQCKRYGALLISDEIYRELTYIPKQPSILEFYENSIVVSGISKSHCMTGWRIGWAAAANEDFIKSVVVAHQYQSTCAPYISQRAAEFALSKDGLETINEIKSQLADSRDTLFSFMNKKLPNVTYLVPQSAPYLFIKIKNDDVKFAALAASKGVVVIPGSAFGENGKGWIRISYALDKDLLIKAMTKLTEILG